MTKYYGWYSAKVDAIYECADNPDISVVVTHVNEDKDNPPASWDDLAFSGEVRKIVKQCWNVLGALDIRRT